MPKAVSTPTTRRREMLAGAGGAGLLAIAASAFAKPDTLATALPGNDAPLIALCAHLSDRLAARQKADDLYAHAVPGKLGYEAAYRASASLHEECDDLMRQVAQLPTARTADGRRARALALRQTAPVDFGLNDLISIRWDQGLIAAVIGDALGGAA